MTHDWERCVALAAELIDAARDEDREPGTICASDMRDAFFPIANRLHEIGVPADVIVQTMRNCAQIFEQWAAAMDAERKRPRLVVFNPDLEG